jgi:hypothetical protein
MKTDIQSSVIYIGPYECIEYLASICLAKNLIFQAFAGNILITSIL